MTVPAALPADESGRLAALADYQILDTAPDERFNRITALAADLLQAPIALVSLVDAERQWFKSNHGLEARETPRNVAFCAHAILDDAPFIIGDAAAHPLFRDNPLVTGAPHIRFYAGIPLMATGGECIGTFCVIDRQPRSLTPAQMKQLRTLAAIAVDELELHKAKVKAEQYAREQEAASRLKSTFLSSMNHEFRTPLNAILGFAQILRMNPEGRLGATELDYITAIETGGNTLLQLTDSIMTMASIEAGQVKLQQEQMLASDVIAEAFDLHRPAAKLNRLMLVENSGQHMLRFRADHKQLLRVLGNFVSNAFKFTPASGTVELGCRGEKDAVVLYVADTGCGIPAGRQQDTFKNFSRLGREGSSVAGSGLGLAIARRLTQAMGGEIGFESQENAGSRFWVRFPIAA